MVSSSFAVQRRLEHQVLSAVQRTGNSSETRKSAVRRTAKQGYVSDFKLVLSVKLTGSRNVTNPRRGIEPILRYNIFMVSSSNG